VRERALVKMRETRRHRRRIAESLLSASASNGAGSCLPAVAPGTRSVPRDANYDGNPHTRGTSMMHEDARVHRGDLIVSPMRESRGTVGRLNHRRPLDNARMCATDINERETLLKATPDDRRSRERRVGETSSSSSSSSSSRSRCNDVSRLVPG